MLFGALAAAGYGDLHAHDPALVVWRGFLFSATVCPTPAQHGTGCTCGMAERIRQAAQHTWTLECDGIHPPGPCPKLAVEAGRRC